VIGFDYGETAAVTKAGHGRFYCAAGGSAMSGEITVDRPIVLVGLMGAGKSCIGRRLAQRLRLPFIDADREIEQAAGCSIPEIFSRHGEQAFRDGERRVILRLLESPPFVLATGGGAFMDPRTRAAIREKAISIWLRADLDLLVRRTGRRSDRPLLQVDDPRARLAELMDTRYPVYAEADLTVDSQDGPPDATLERVLAALSAFEPRTDSKTAAGTGRRAASS
jgi:shikimate kinase